MHDNNSLAHTSWNCKYHINYLISVLYSSEKDRELLNALRMLREVTDICGLEEETRKALMDLILSGKCNCHHIRDSIIDLVDLKLGNTEVTALLCRQFGKTTDHEILRGLNYYSYHYRCSDTFIEGLLYQLVNIDYSHYLGAYFQECLKSLKEEASFIKLFEVIKKTDNKRQILSDMKAKEIFPVYDETFIGIWKDKEKDDLLQTVLDVTVCLIKEYAIEENPFSGFLNCASKTIPVIDYYYDKLKHDPFHFITAVNELDEYLSFLTEKYTRGDFLDDGNRFFTLCVRAFPADSPERESCLLLIRETGYDDAEEAVLFITDNDDYSKKAHALMTLNAEYIFDFAKMKHELGTVVKGAGESNPGCQQNMLCVPKVRKDQRH